MSNSEEAKGNGPATPPAAEPMAVDISTDNGKLTVSVPFAAGKLAVYGALKVAEEAAAKMFWTLERAERMEKEKARSILEKLHLPGMRRSH